MKMLLTRKIIAYLLLVIGSVYLVLEYYQHSWFIAIKNAQHRINKAQVNETWAAARKVLLSKQNVSKVIILAHARGGSTLGSDIFNIETNNTVLWYEALRAFYSFYSGVPHFSVDSIFLYYTNLTRRPADHAKQNELANYLRQLMTCDFENVPVELVSMISSTKKSAVFKDVVDCMRKVKAFDRFYNCQELISKYCYFEELMGDSADTVNDSLASSFKCAELLKSIRRMKSLPMHRVTISELLRSYLNSYDSNKGSLEHTVYSVCPEFTNISGDPEELLTSVENNISNKRCMNLASKLKLFLKHDKCLESLNNDAFPCRQQMAAPCRRTRLTVAEFQRVFMAELEPFVQQMPDIHAVHFVRDPRATSVSRAEKHIHTFRAESSWTAVNETSLLCQRMRYDIGQRKRLQRIYPGSIITVRYEDLVLDPETTVNRMYEFFGRPLPRGLSAWVERTMHADRDDGMYGVKRIDGKRQLSKWRSKVTVDDVAVMNHCCLDVLREYEYEL